MNSTAQCVPNPEAGVVQAIRELQIQINDLKSELRNFKAEVNDTDAQCCKTVGEIRSE